MLREAQTKLNRTRKNLARLEKVEKQIMKAKAHMTEDEILEFKAQSSKLNYGLKFWSSYKGHERSEVDAILWNPNSK